MRVKSLSCLFSFLSVFLFLFFSQARAATITPATFDDDFDGSTCSLRDAVQSINTVGDFGGCNHTGDDYGINDTIILEEGEYELTIGGSGEDDNETGDIDILKPVIIQGQGVGVTTVRANFDTGSDRIFDISVTSECPGDLGPFDFDVTLSGMTITGGSADLGGGIYHHGSKLLIQDLDVVQNGALSGGGIENAVNPGHCSIMFINQSTVEKNQAEAGGGIDTSTELFIDESIIDHNNALAGGGIFNAENLIIRNSTISFNEAVSEGGGIFDGIAEPERMYLINSTISNNMAGIAGGGVAHDFSVGDSTGGVSEVSQEEEPPRRAIYFNVTVADNQVTEQGGQGGGLFIPIEEVVTSTSEPGAQQFPLPQLFNTLLGNNSAEQGPDCFGSYDSQGFNLVEDLGGAGECGTFGQTGDQTGEDPNLGPLDKNGGPTPTRALLVGSPAIDKGNNVDGCQAPDFDELLQLNFVLTTLTRDQRGFTRPVAILDPNDPICDIGAFEVQQFNFNVTKTDGQGGSTIPTGTEFDYTITITNPGGAGDATNVTLSDPLPSGMSFVSVATTQGTCSESGGTVTCDLGTLVDGASITVTITVTAGGSGTFTNVATVTLLNPQEQEMTKTAQVTTEVSSLTFEGSGKFCSLEKGDPRTPPGFALLLFSIMVMIGSVYLSLRRRAKCLR